MIFDLFKNLLWKELKVISSSFKGFIGSYRGLIGISFLVLVGMAGLIVTFYSLFSMYLGDTPYSERASDVAVLIKFILLWLTFLIFFTTIQESKDKFFNEEFNFLLSTPLRPWLLFIMRLIKTIFISLGNNLVLLFFGIGPLIALGIIFSTSWTNYFGLILVSYLYLTVPVALAIVCVIFVMRLFPLDFIVSLSLLISFSLIFAWLFFLTAGQEILIDSFIARIGEFESYIQWFYPLVITEGLIRDLVLDYPMDTYRLSAIFMPMVVFTIIVSSFLIQGLYRKSYEKYKISSKRSLPTIKISWVKALKRKLSPFRRLGLIISTNLKLVFRNYLTAARGFLGIILIFMFVIISAQVPGDRQAITTFLIFSVLLVVFILNFSFSILFKPTEYYVFYKLAPFSAWYTLLNIWGIRLLFQLIIGGFFLTLYFIFFDISPFLFFSLLIFLILLQASLESLVIFINIINYKGVVVYFCYLIYFILLIFFVLLINLGEEITIWIINMINLVVFVVFMSLCESYWNLMEVND